MNAVVHIFERQKSLMQQLEQVFCFPNSFFALDFSDFRALISGRCLCCQAPIRSEALTALVSFWEPQDLFFPGVLEICKKKSIRFQLLVLLSFSTSPILPGITYVSSTSH